MAQSGISSEEVKFTVSMARQANAITPEQEKIVHNILEMDDRRARDIMTPRTVVLRIWIWRRHAKKEACGLIAEYCCTVMIEIILLAWSYGVMYSPR